MKPHLGSHLNERRVRGEEEGINDSEDNEPFKELSDFGSENEAPDTELPVNVSDLPTDDKKITDLPSEVVSVPEITPSDINTTNSQELEDLLDKALELKSAATSAKKYGLKDLETELDKNNQEEKKGRVREKAYISKAERRKFKKGQTHSEGEDSGQWKKEVEKKNEVDNQSQKDIQSLNCSAKVSRGQKGKLKKMKKNMRIKMKKKGKSAWLYSRRSKAYRLRLLFVVILNYLPSARQLRQRCCAIKVRYAPNTIFSESSSLFTIVFTFNSDLVIAFIVCFESGEVEFKGPSYVNTNRQDSQNMKDDEPLLKIEISNPGNWSQLCATFKCTSPLFRSRNSAVVVAAAGLHWIMAPKEDIDRIVKPLLFLLRSSDALKYVVLSNVQVFTKVIPSLFAPNFEDFFINSKCSPCNGT
ncbi:hypothetical protein L2E82_46712 [Cichorium intybus]|uniref:Uncharacterized protein n=1 Tax=Cichorium intybus TaxID=13427 RepID=A0ACB8YXU0_CICIN|nr:hypothetical protein L2E82_46712 [Cichorium intybus]